MTNEKIAKLYDKALIIESNGDYVAGELDPVKFAELIVRECMSLVSEPGPDMNDTERGILAQIKEHFGVKE